MGIEIKYGLHVFERYGVKFRIIDNARRPLSIEEAKAIADYAANEPIYWNDCDCYYWMFDFKVGDHWCEGLFREDVMEQFGQENPYDTLNINVYE